MRAVVTVIGKDMVGILAKVSAACAQANANVIEVTQSVLQDMFAMIMLVDIQNLNLPFDQFAAAVDRTQMANDYLTQVNLHSGELPESIRAAKRVLVVGGGNVAVDAVRCARRLGAETIMVYRRTIAEAPARRDEIAHTYEEDIPIRELTNPVACYGENGVLTGVKCEKMALGEPDASGRRRPVGTGEFFDVPCDNLVIATGTSYSEEVVDTTTGIQKDRWGGIAAGEDGQTSRPGVFAGGDAVTGPKTVVQAMGAGKRAAVSIDKYLSER